jgi:hypothetical protein
VICLDVYPSAHVLMCPMLVNHLSQCDDLISISLYKHACGRFCQANHGYLINGINGVDRNQKKKVNGLYLAFVLQSGENDIGLFSFYLFCSFCI